MTKQDKIDELNNLATQLTGLPEIKDSEYAKCYYDRKKNRQITSGHSKLFKLDRKIL